MPRLCTVFLFIYLFDGMSTLTGGIIIELRNTDVDMAACTFVFKEVIW